MSIGDNIKRVRLHNGISQKKLAEILEIPVSTLANYENNHREPKTEVLKKIAESLDVSLMDLIYDRDVEKEEERLKKLREQIPEPEQDIIHWSPSTIEELNEEFEFENAIKELLKCSKLQKDFNYNEFELKVKANSIDEIKEFIYDMLKMKIAEIKSRK